MVELVEGQDRILLGSTWGVSFLAEKGQPYGQLNSIGYTRDSTSGAVVVNESSFPLTTPNKNFGSAYPDYTGGVTNEFSIYRFNVSTLIDFRKGGSIFSVTNQFGNYSGMFENTVGTNAQGNPLRNPVGEGGGILVDGIKADGSPNDVYVEAKQYYEATYDLNEQYIYDASFIKLREVSIGRQLPAAWFENNFITNASLSLTGRNLAILHKNAPNIDPDAALSNGNVQGIENGQNPSVRSFGVNLNVSF